MMDGRLYPRLVVAFVAVGALIMASLAIARGIDAAPAPRTSCQRLAEQVRGALGAGRIPDDSPGLAQSMRVCLAEARAAKVLGPATDLPMVSPSAVVASYQISDFSLCLSFNSNGSVTSTDPTWHVMSGSYVGDPATFSVFSYSGSSYIAGFNAIGVTIGPFLLQFFSLDGNTVLQTGFPAVC